MKKVDVSRQKWMQTNIDDTVSQDYMACLIYRSSTKILPLSMLNIVLICSGFLRFIFVEKECVKHKRSK